MKIYPSNIPNVPIYECSLYNYVFPENDPYPPSTAAFIDADTGRKVTRQELRTLTLEFAYGLRNVLGPKGGQKLTRGDTVMIFSPNSIAYPLMLYGINAAGIRATLANSAYTAPEIAHQYSDSCAKVVLVHPALLPTVVEMFKLLKVDPRDAQKRIIVASWGLDNAKIPSGFLELGQLLGKGSMEPERFDGPQSNETALLCYSSGTTGKPKGVETTHRNLTSVLAVIQPALPVHHGLDVFVGVLPFYHIYGAVNLVQYAFLKGVPVAVMPKFDPVAFCKTVETYKVTVGLIVPPILVVLARHPAAAQFNLKSLRILVSGAAPLGAPLVKAVTERLKSFGNVTPITQGYGLTETSPTACIVPEEAALRKVGTIGVLLPNLEARLVLEDGSDAKEGEPGELWIRGPTIMKGYLNNPTATKNSITEDGFFKTGDVAVRDEEGFYQIVDRQKELIKYKGFQVPPAELESVLLQHPDIADSGVIAVDSVEEATELPRAYVVHAKGLKTDAEKQQFAKEVQRWIETRVAKHKYLRGGCVVIDAIPKSASGKILRRELKDRAKVEYEAEKRSGKARL